MVEEPEEDKKLGLAAAIARGVSIRRWANANGVCARTAQRWAKEALVRTEAQAIRRQMLDEFIGAMASRSGLVVKGISALAQDAQSESVKLSALKAILAQMVSVARYSELEGRIAEFEEELRRDPQSFAPLPPR
jgi:hypothetical protein